ncbi:MAG: hypothetical protein FJ135_15855 [Deltaproteobacteria bacterium]|nr:hypothetical protein [Deltaproteobacteria bacterium]
MSVKIIRPQTTVQYNMEVRKVVIQFLDGSQMVGYINIHAKFSGSEKEGEYEDSHYEGFQLNEEEKFKFRRTSDYLRHCNERDGMITVFNASYGGFENKVCFVFLHSVKFIGEEQEMKKVTEEKPEPQPEDTGPPREGLWHRLKER